MATLSANIIGAFGLNNGTSNIYITDAGVAAQVLTFNQDDIESMVAGQASAAVTAKETYIPPTYTTTGEDSSAVMSPAVKSLWDSRCRTIIRLKQRPDGSKPVLISSDEIAAINATKV